MYVLIKSYLQYEDSKINVSVKKSYFYVYVICMYVLKIYLDCTI